MDKFTFLIVYTDVAITVRDRANAGMPVHKS